MRRVMLLALLALALPTAALANSTPVCKPVGVPWCGVGGFIRNGSSQTLTGSWSFTVEDVQDRLFGVTISPAHLTEVSPSDCPSVLSPERFGSFECFKFSGGRVSGCCAFDVHGGFLLNSRLTGGFLGVDTQFIIDDRIEGVSVITADFGPSSGLGIAGGDLSGTWIWEGIIHGEGFQVEPRQPFPNNHMTISTRVVPEPGTLGLLGTGLIGLFGMARRKLKLGT